MNDDRLFQRIQDAFSDLQPVSSEVFGSRIQVCRGIPYGGQQLMDIVDNERNTRPVYPFGQDAVETTSNECSLALFQIDTR